MTYTATQHIPGCCDGVTPYEIEFDTTESLLKNSEIASNLGLDGHTMFCRSADGKALMSENPDGTHWFVLAHVPHGSIDSLPVVRMREVSDE